MIKLIVSDMDGTLFNSNQEISPYNVAAIKEAEKQNVRFMIATGRSIDTIGPTVDKYNLNCGFILVNGAEVRDEERNIISTNNIEEDVARRLAKRLKEMGYIPEYMTNKGAYICDTKENMELNMGYRLLCLDRDHKLTLEQAIEEGKTSVFMTYLTRNDSIDEMFANHIEIRKAIVFNPDGNFNNENRKKLIEEFPELCIASSYPENIEINTKLGNKGHGIKNAIQAMGIKEDEVAVFGDGLNDLPMIEAFVHTYAPMNAELEVKQKASEIIPSNNDDGVGKKIHEILYKNREEQLFG